MVRIIKILTFSHYIIYMATRVASESLNPSRCSRKSECTQNDIYTKNGHFRSPIPAAILQLKIGQLRRAPRKDADYLTSVIILNKFNFLKGSGNSRQNPDKVAEVFLAKTTEYVRVGRSVLAN